MYECHITVETDNPQLAKTHITEIGWKFSKIDGDPTLGKGVKCYATNHYNPNRTQKNVIISLHLASNCLAARGLTVIREKVELIIYDTKRKQ